MAKYIITVISDFWVSKFAQYTIQKTVPCAVQCIFEVLDLSCTGQTTAPAILYYIVYMARITDSKIKLAFR